MRVVLRADASVAQGSGHVMRCLTLGEELVARGHEVLFAGDVSAVGWMASHLEASGLERVAAEPDRLDIAALEQLEPDWVVVDSYRIPADEVSALSARLPVLAIVDGTARGIRAQLLLDQNLGAERHVWDEKHGRVLAGAKYAMIRDQVLAVRRSEPWRLPDRPRVMAFMGGTDPTHVVTPVVGQLATIGTPFDLTVVAPVASHAALQPALDRMGGGTLLPPTDDLPSLLGRSDLVISAAGTSAWDVCTLGIPAVLVGVIDNQSGSLAEAMDRGLALGIDLDRGGDLAELPGLVRRLLTDAALRRDLSANCAAEFDGLGKARVVDVLEGGASTPREEGDR